MQACRPHRGAFRGDMFLLDSKLKVEFLRFANVPETAELGVQQGGELVSRASGLPTNT